MQLKITFKTALFGAVCGIFFTCAATATTVHAAEQERIPTSTAAEDNSGTVMWAVTEAVCYADASTDSSELGNLPQHEQVSVLETENNWCRIQLNGQEAYVPAVFLTAEDPHNRELNIFNKETGLVDTYIFKDQDPAAIDSAIEKIKEEYADKAPDNERKKTSPDQRTNTGSVLENTEAEPVKHSIYWWMVLISAAGSFLVFCTAVFFLIYNKSQRTGRIKGESLKIVCK